MLSTVQLLLVISQISFGLGQLWLFNECPLVDLDPNLKATDCPVCFHCAATPGNLCCPNECGTYSCTFVMNSCMYNGMEYDHHNWMPLPNDWENDRCGDCWCQNGKKRCNTYSCKILDLPSF